MKHTIAIILTMAVILSALAGCGVAGKQASTMAEDGEETVLTVRIVNQSAVNLYGSITAPWWQWIWQNLILRFWHFSLPLITQIHTSTGTQSFICAPGKPAKQGRGKIAMSLSQPKKPLIQRLFYA